MIVTLKGWAKDHREEITRVEELIKSYGLQIHDISGVETIVIAVIGVGDSVTECEERLRQMEVVAGVTRISDPNKCVGRAYHKNGTTVVEVNGVAIGGEDFAVIAGPCSVESAEQIERVAEKLAQQGVKLLRGGAYKPRTRPGCFEGLGLPGLRLMRTAADRHGLAIVTEVMTPEKVEQVAEYADVLQVGARNCQNFDLLKALACAQKPVLLKRGAGCDVEEFLGAAEYIVRGGNKQVILCVRGIRTFDRTTRYTYDVGAVPVLQQMTHLPACVDPSHPAGDAQLVIPYAYAACAIGAHGIIVEIHPDPEAALSDGKQSLNFAQFDELMAGLKLFDEARQRLSLAKASLAFEPVYA